MAKESETVVPRLRFPDFRDERGWVSRNLGEIAQFTSGGTPSKDEPSYWNGTIPWISASSMYETRIADSELKISPLAIGNGTRLARKGSLLILVRGSMLFNRVPIGIAAIDVAFNQDVKALSLCGDANEKFVLYQLIAVSPRIPVNETGIGAGKIETDVLAGLLIHLPSSIEQQKIADCLTWLDEVITYQGRKVEVLKTYKRGLMQQLFPREGETLPRLRFPEFRDAPEWEKTQLGKICDMQAGKFVAASEIADSQGTGSYACFGGNGLRGYTKTYTHAGRHSLIGRQGALCGNVNLVDGRFHATEHAVVSTPKTGFGVDWLFYALGFLNLNRFATGQAQPGLSVEVLERVELTAPLSELEQQAIAECLSSLDTRITVESNKLAALRTHKKGLMQQLFPRLEETP